MKSMTAVYFIKKKPNERIFFPFGYILHNGRPSAELE